MKKYETKHDMLKRDILLVFNQTMERMCKGGANVLVGEIIAEAHKSQAPRFYVSPREAQEQTVRFLKGEHLNVRRREMYAEIARRYLEQKDRHNYGRTSIHIFEKIVEQPAPSFYLTFKSFRKILYEALNDSSLRKPLTTNRHQHMLCST